MLNSLLPLTNTDVPPLHKKLLDHPNPYKPLLPFLSHSTNPEDPIPLLTSSVLTNLIASAQVQNPKPSAETDEALPRLYTYLSTLTKSQDSGLQDIAVQHYSSLLRTKNARDLFWKQREDTVAPIMDILRAAAGASKDNDSTLWSGKASIRSAPEVRMSGGVGLQLLYHVLLTIWQLSFEASLVGRGLEKLAMFLLLLRNLRLRNHLESKKLSPSIRNCSVYPQRRKRRVYSSPHYQTSLPHPPIERTSCLLLSPSGYPLFWQI